ncbi:MAG: GHKL domain-containing protein [Lachnospiraceae bacterium]|nr:GHKL domain-containing protein [Lachnospiraceae bacterium]
MEQIINIIGWFLELLMIEMCVHFVWNSKSKIRFLTVLLFLYNGLAFLLITNKIVPYYCRYIIYILIFITCYVEFRSNFVKTFKKFLIAMTFAGIAEVLAAFAVAPFESRINSQTGLLVAVNTVSIIIVFVFHKLFRKRDRNSSYGLADEKVFHTMIFCTIPVVIMIIDYSIHQELRIIYDMVISVLIIVIYKYLLKVRITEKELEKKNLELEMQRIYGDAYKELLDEVRKRQHDFKNQLTAIYSMHLVAETLDELVEMQKEYCEKLEENIRYDQILTKCNEPILAGFLYYKCIACEKMGVKVDYTISVTSAECQIALHEIIEIIGIFMDNACEQVVELSCDSRTIELSVDDNDGAITIEIGNPSRPLTSREIEQMFQPGFSTKGENRGLGLPRVKQLVKNHNLELIVFNSEKYGRSRLNFKLIIKK